MYQIGLNVCGYGEDNMCTPACVYFPETKEILSIKEIDGVRYCKSVYRCNYSLKRIKNWEKCHRKDGPLVLSEKELQTVSVNDEVEYV